MVCSGPLPIVKLDCFGGFFFFFFLLLNHMSSLYVLDINPLSDRWLANIFSQFVDCLLVLLTISFVVFFILMKSQKFIFTFVSLASGDVS